MKYKWFFVNVLSKNIMDIFLTFKSNSKNVWCTLQVTNDWCEILCGRCNDHNYIKHVSLHLITIPKECAESKSHCHFFKPLFVLCQFFRKFAWPSVWFNLLTKSKFNISFEPSLRWEWGYKSSSWEPCTGGT